MEWCRQKERGHGDSEPRDRCWTDHRCLEVQVGGNNLLVCTALALFSWYGSTHAIVERDSLIAPVMKKAPGTSSGAERFSFERYYLTVQDELQVTVLLAVDVPG